MNGIQRDMFIFIGVYITYEGWLHYLVDLFVQFTFQYEFFFIIII